MRFPLLLAAAAFAATVLTTASVRADEANTALTASIIALGRGDVPTAHTHLDTAEASTSEGSMLAKIHRQRGIVFEVEARRVDALLSFLRGLYFDATLKLPEREHKGEVQRIFDCAKALAEAGIKEAAVKARYQKDLEKADWRCPVGVEAMGAVTAPSPAPEPTPTPAPAPVSPTPTLTPTPTVEPTPTPPEPPVTAAAPVPEEEKSERRGLLSRPLFWIVVGAVVVGGAVTTAVLLSGGIEDGYGGSTGVNILLPGGGE